MIKLANNNSVNSSQVFCLDKTGNPAPLGLICFSITIILYGLHFSGILEVSSLLWMVGLFLAGFGQFLVGIMEWKKGNSFGTTAFTAYGIFWIATISTNLLNFLHIGSPPSPVVLSIFLILYGIFTFGLYIISLKLDKKIQAIFLTLAVTFFILGFTELNPNIVFAKILSGFMCVFCGIISMYASFRFLFLEYSNNEK